MDAMHVELNPVLLLLMALLVALLGAALVRMAGVKGWLLVGVLLLVCAGTNPDKAGHTRVVRQAARTQLAREASAINNVGLMAELKNGQFEPRAAYHDLGVASVVVIHGEVLSFGVLGQVWVTNLKQLAHATRL